MKEKSQVRKRRKMAVLLRLQGYTQQQIAQEIGVSQSVVSDYLSKASERDKNMLRQEQLWRIQELMFVAMEQALETGSMAAIDRYLKLEERQAKLLGLYASADQQRVKSPGRTIVIGEL